jgi:hypothetical protein
MVASTTQHYEVAQRLLRVSNLGFMERGATSLAMMWLLCSAIMLSKIFKISNVL